MGATQRIPAEPRVNLVLERTRKSLGYAPVPDRLIPEICRLASGGTFHALMWWVCRLSFGRIPDKGKPRASVTLPVSVQDLAECCCCDERSIQRELDAWQKRKIALVKRADRGRVTIQLLHNEWPNLPDYAPPKPVDISTGKESEAEEPEEQKSTPGFQKLTPKAQTVKAGRKARVMKVNCGVNAFQFENTSVLDLQFEAMVQGGRLVVTARVPEKHLRRKEERGRNQSSLRAPVTKGQSSLDARAPATRRGTQPNVINPVGRPSRQVRRQTHPRAAELCALLDPLLLRSCNRSLSADQIALDRACEAVGSTDHDFLVKTVIERFERPVKSPKHVAAILLECRENWEKVRDLPAAQRVPKQPARKSFVSDVAQVLARRLKDGTL